MHTDIIRLPPALDPTLAETAEQALVRVYDKTELPPAGRKYRHDCTDAEAGPAQNTDDPDGHLGVICGSIDMSGPSGPVVTP